MNDKTYISWNDFHQDVKNLCQKIKQTNIQYDKIVAISRGGFIPAGIIAYELDIRNSAVVNISTYINNKQTKLEKINNIETIGKIDEKTLIIDDLSDSGQTIKIMRETFKNGTYVTVYAKEKGKSYPDIYEKDMPNHWLVFPWDIE